MHTFSLGKAHKLLQALKEALKASSSRTRRFFSIDPEPSHRGAIEVEFPVRGLSDAEVVAGIQRQIENARKSLERHLALEEDAGRLKEAIFAANQTSGVSERMTRQTFLNKRISILQALLSQIENAEVNAVSAERVTEELIHGLREAANAEQSEISLTVTLSDPEKLREQICQDRQEVNRLDEEIRALNATTTVQVELHEVTRELLGLG